MSHSDEELPADARTDERPIDDDLPVGDERRVEEMAVDESSEPRRSTMARAARRVTRRPREWAQQPWTNDRIVRFAVTFLSLAICTFIMSRMVHLGYGPESDLIFDDNTPTGGDFGAHVWGPDFLKDHVLPGGWFNGWSMDWYAGLPAYRFYMVLPAFAILIADIFFSYGVAMKLISILGVLTIPASCWAFGRLANFRYPIPEVMTFAGLAFVLDESYQIFGGNLKSTMAGEFSFSIALSVGIVGLGVLAKGLQTGRHRVLAPILIATACVSHGIVLIYMAVFCTIICLVWVDLQRLKWILTTGVTVVLLTLWWAGPFVFNHDYMTDMKYAGEPIGASFDTFWDMYFPLTAPLDFVVMTLACAGFLISIMRRQLIGTALGVTMMVFFVLVAVTKDASLPGIGLLWNPRLLPALYLARYLLMAIGAVEVMNILVNLARNRRAQANNSVAANTVYAAVFNVSVLIVVGFMFQTLPGWSNEYREEFDATASTTKDERIDPVYGMDIEGPFLATESNTKAVGSSWARYNFLGYEGRGASWDEYSAVVEEMGQLGDQHGCGRAVWEHADGNDSYGTPMALMLLPYWTDGCIGSMEGLFFEASGTTPYHFLLAAALSDSSSEPVRQLRYDSQRTNGPVAVRQMEALGVKYAMVRSDAAIAEADAQPELTKVGESGPWSIYLHTVSQVIEPLDVQPVVVNERGGDRRERLLEIGTSWYQNPGEWAAMPANGGPDEWQRIDVDVDMSQRSISDYSGKQDLVDVVVPADEIEVVELPEAEVSNVDIRQQSLSFDVDQVGVPVQVKVSYFPNWTADGADGPYRIGPNMMVVVPTDTHVEMSFDQNGLDYVTFLATLIGIGLLFLWRKQGPIQVTPVLFGAEAAALDAEQTRLAGGVDGAAPVPGRWEWDDALNNWVWVADPTGVRSPGDDGSTAPIDTVFAPDAEATGPAADPGDVTDEVVTDPYSSADAPDAASDDADGDDRPGVGPPPR